MSKKIKQKKIPVKVSTSKKPVKALPKTSQKAITSYSDYVLDAKGNKILKVSKLNEATRKKYRNTLIRLDNANLTLTKAKKMDVDELRNALGSKASDNSIKALKRVLNQMSKNSERRDYSVKTALKKIKTEAKLNDKQANIKKKELVITSGNIYAEVVEIYKKKYKGNTLIEIQDEVRSLLNYKITDKEFKELSNFEKEIILEYGS